jgi:hypothetical protein
VLSTKTRSAFGIAENVRSSCVRLFLNPCTMMRCVTKRRNLDTVGGYCAYIYIYTYISRLIDLFCWGAYECNGRMGCWAYILPVMSVPSRVAIQYKHSTIQYCVPQTIRYNTIQFNTITIQYNYNTLQYNTIT